jgi:NADPH:quinone reductase-like Zn-dependent oxidoreductase
MTTSITAPTKTLLSEGQILIKVITAAINPADYKIPEAAGVGKLVSPKPPVIPGLDFCGRVVGLHSSDTSLLEGQLVFGALNRAGRLGTLGEFIIVSREECALLPPGLDLDQAAAIGTAGLTAYQSFNLEIVKPGSKVLINGGSGGCGTFGIQIAKARGAEVTVTCSTANVELCKSLGADEVIDYKTSDLLLELRNKGPIFDLVVDNAGSPADLYERSATFLKPMGLFVQVAVTVTLSGLSNLFWRVVKPKSLNGKKGKFMFLRNASSRKDFDQIAQWMVEGKVMAVVDEVFTFEDVPRAYEKLRLGRTRGKILVRVGEEGKR